MSLKITQFNFTEQGGGAFIAGRRLHDALTKAGNQASLLVMRKKTSDSTVSMAKDSWLSFAEPLIHRMLENVFADPVVHRFSFGFAFSSMNANARTLIKESDAIILYWICSGLLSPREIGWLARQGKPILWRLSDMWPMTGGCHHASDCNLYQQSCGNCPQLRYSGKYDLSKWLWRWKSSCWENLPLVIVSPSAWLAGCAKASSLFRNKRIEVIPTGVDLSLYKPLDKKFARMTLGLPEEATILLAGAIDLMGPFKGGALLVEALKKWGEKRQNGLPHMLVMFGSNREAKQDLFPIPVKQFGPVVDERQLSLLYAASDVFVIPSMQENLPNTMLESMACGTPCVAFHVGGIPDAIEHMNNGFLVEPFSTDEFARGIELILSDDEVRCRFGQAARKTMETKFDLAQSAKKYIQLIEKLKTEDRSIQSP